MSGVLGFWTLRAEAVGVKFPQNSRMWKKLENPEANCWNFISAYSAIKIEVSKLRRRGSAGDVGFPSVCCEYRWLIKKLA